jgi:hypothetical protein
LLLVQLVLWLPRYRYFPQRLFRQWLPLDLWLPRYRYFPQRLFRQWLPLGL